MVEITMPEITATQKIVLQPTNESPRNKEVLDSMLAWHDQFDAMVWQANGHDKSFHNRSHIEAVQEASTTYIQNSSRENDPVGFYESLDRYNQTNPGLEVQDEEIEEVVPWAIHSHDLGNIMEDLTVEESGELKPHFHGQYIAKGAEDRSQKFVATLLEQSDFDADKKARYTHFAQHLIGETVFMPQDPNAPFARFMRTMDQIGNDFFSTNPDRVEGLMDEMVTENPEAKMFGGPDGFINFARRRLPVLVGDEAVQKQLVEEIWHEEMPQEVPNLSKDTITINEYRTLSLAL